MKRILLFFCLIFLAIICSCNSEKDIYYTVRKKIINMESYSAEVRIKSYGNKETSSYVFKQYFKEPNKIRIETIEPDFLKGKILIYNGKAWIIKHPLINQIYETKDVKETKDYILLGIIQRSILSENGDELSKVKKDGVEYIQIKCKLYTKNDYRDNAKLYISSDTLIPKILEIYNKSNNVVLRADYINFDYNIKLNEDLFVLK